MDMEVTIFTMITHSGESRSFSMEAIAYAKKGMHKEAEAALKSAKEKLRQAHEIQTGLIHSEAQGKSVTLSLLMVHSQDHFMNAMTIRDLAKEFVELYSRLNLCEQEAIQ